MEKQQMKKIYSLNLAAFIYMITHLEPHLYEDEMGKISFLYPDTSEITLLINIYRKNQISVNLKEFLNAFRTIKKLSNKRKYE